MSRHHTSSKGSGPTSTVEVLTSAGLGDEERTAEVTGASGTAVATGLPLASLGCSNTGLLTQAHMSSTPATTRRASTQLTCSPAPTPTTMPTKSRRDDKAGHLESDGLARPTLFQRSPTAKFERYVSATSSRPEGQMVVALLLESSASPRKRSPILYADSCVKKQVAPSSRHALETCARRGTPTHLRTPGSEQAMERAYVVSVAATTTTGASVPDIHAYADQEGVSYKKAVQRLKEMQQ